MKSFLILLLLIMLNVAVAEEAPKKNAFFSWADATKARLHQIWMEGTGDLYIPAYSWHNRYRYSRSRIDRYNEHPWGGGFGKGLFDEKANWHSLFAFAFLDSHKNVEPVAGYGYLKVSHFNERLAFGGGYTILVTARPDIFHNIPFPGILPLLSLSYQRASITATYVPGAKNAGNVLFVFFRYVLQ